MSAPDQKNTAGLLQKLDKDLAHMRGLLIDRHASARNSLRIILFTL